MQSESWLQADWPAPQNVHAGTTTRLGGVSEGEYASLNLAQHVNDEPGRVEQNRERLKSFLGLPGDPHWLKQVHGCRVSTDDIVLREADASISKQKGRVCTVMTADCLPVLITDKSGSCIAAVHAGWRGLQQQTIAHTIKAMQSEPYELLAWLGPAIGPQAFEVGDEVRELFLEQGILYADAFVAGEAPGKWFMDVYSVARMQLQAMNVTNIYGGGFCTYTDQERFFSYRRDKVTGRMASLIWMS